MTQDTRNVMTDMVAMAWPDRAHDDGRTDPPTAPASTNTPPELLAELTALRRARREQAAGPPVPNSEVTAEMIQMAYPNRNPI
ncbi:MAG: hypothetical protein WCK05_12865 [Planctomycetota bacterium]